jgi:transcriptional regulator with PAS, ATPase and Fis domain
MAHRHEIPVIVGESPAMQRVKALIEPFARTTAIGLVTGESGTGKELFVRAVHARSGRSPLVPVNCAGMPESLFESELFGHVRGAFTGADRDKPGLMQAADGGTLFLDEIGEMPLSIQPKLLRAIVTGELRRVGANQSRTVNVRFLAATNRDLEHEVAKGRFRDDLFGRLDVMRVDLPPLRDRPGDVRLLIDHFVGLHRVTGEAIAALEAYQWPRNVRELHGTLTSGAALAGSEMIELEHIRERLRAKPTSMGAGARTNGVLRKLDEVEREHIENVIAHTRGNKSEAARILGINRETLRKKLVGFGPK